MKRSILRSAPSLAALLLAGCNVAPLTPPQVETPAAFRQAAPSGAAAWKPAQAAEAQPRGEWWRVFGDPALNGLVGQAGAANASLAQAAARVKQSRALADRAGAQRSVALDAGLGAERARAALPAAGGPAATRPAAASAWQGALTASYEVDLFGRVGGTVGAARADAEASEASYRSVLLALQADVVQSYFRLRATDAELATLEQAVQLRQQSLQLSERRYELGDIGEFDLVRARTELASARADAIGLQRQRASLEHALAVLLGKPAGAFAFPPQPLAEGSAPPTIPAGVPATLLERRPDISAAQRLVAAAHARTGVARSARFPALMLSASGGAHAATLSQLAQLDVRSWAVGALLSLPLIDGGRRRADIAYSDAQFDESVALYRNSVLLAFAEVEDNLAGLRILAAQEEQQALAVASARRSVALAQRLYQAGRSSYLELLDAQRNLASVERAAVQLRASRYVSTVALIRALGGGWDAGPGGAADPIRG